MRYPCLLPVTLLSLVALGFSAEPACHPVQQEIRHADLAVQKGPFQPDWDSLRAYKIPAWYQDAKFGIFIHWGLYSVPAFDNEWYSRNMYQQNMPEFRHHVETYGPQSVFGYKDFIPRFKAEHFDPDAWALLFRQAGARYVVPVAEHHDGFAMYDTRFSRWTAARMGPHRDVIAELSRSVRKQGMHFGLSYHRAEHWWFFDGGRQFDSDVRDERFRDFYGPAQSDHTQPDRAFVEDWFARAVELADKYDPEVFYFDWWIKQPAYTPYVKKFAAYYYNRASAEHRGVVINYKEEAMPEGTAVLDVERGQLAGMRTPYWQTDTSTSWKSWCYIENDHYRTPQSIVQLLVDVVSKNGGLLLNVGPKPDGTFPEEIRHTLLAIGHWLDVNGEAIYASRPWREFGEGPTRIEAGSKSEGANKEFTAQDVRFTRKGNVLYAAELLPSGDGRLTIAQLGTSAREQILKVEMLGSQRPVRWQQSAAGLLLESDPIRNEGFPVVFRITLQDGAAARALPGDSR